MHISYSPMQCVGRNLSEAVSCGEEKRRKINSTATELENERERERERNQIFISPSLEKLIRPHQCYRTSYVGVELFVVEDLEHLGFVALRGCKDELRAFLEFLGRFRDNRWDGTVTFVLFHEFTGGLFGLVLWVWRDVCGSV